MSMGCSARQHHNHWRADQLFLFAARRHYERVAIHVSTSSQAQALENDNFLQAVSAGQHAQRQPATSNSQQPHGNRKRRHCHHQATGICEARARETTARHTTPKAINRQSKGFFCTTSGSADNTTATTRHRGGNSANATSSKPYNGQDEQQPILQQRPKCQLHARQRSTPTKTNNSLLRMLHGDATDSDAQRVLNAGDAPEQGSGTAPCYGGPASEHENGHAHGARARPSGARTSGAFRGFQCLG